MGMWRATRDPLPQDRENLLEASAGCVNSFCGAGPYLITLNWTSSRPRPRTLWGKAVQTAFVDISVMMLWADAYARPSRY